MTSKDFNHLYDTILSAGLRFLVELIAWIAGSLAIAKWYNGLWIPFLLVLVLLPSIFSTKGDKRNVVVATPGLLRVFIELLLYLVATISPWFIWPTAVCIASTLMVGASLIFGLPRLVWLAKGANKV